MVTLSYQMTIPSSPSLSLMLVASCVSVSIRVNTKHLIVRFPNRHECTKYQYEVGESYYKSLI